VRVTNIAVNILDAMPQKSVTANPLTGPVPVCINIIAVSRVVISESVGTPGVIRRNSGSKPIESYCQTELN